MSALKAGSVLTIPGLPGRWSVWSPASTTDYPPGCYFVIDAAGVRGGYAVVRAIQRRTDANLVLRLVDDQTKARR